MISATKIGERERNCCFFLEMKRRPPLIPLIYLKEREYKKVFFVVVEIQSKRERISFLIFLIKKKEYWYKNK